MNSSTNDGYQCFEQLIENLRAEGHGDVATKLDYLLHKVAWTTGSELLGEMGLEILRFQRNRTTATAEMRHSLDSCMDTVRRVWPNIR